MRQLLIDAIDFDDVINTVARNYKEEINEEEEEENVPNSEVLLKEMNLDGVIIDAFGKAFDLGVDYEEEEDYDEDNVPNTTELEPFIVKDSEEEDDTPFGPPPKTHASSSTDIDISIADSYDNNSNDNNLKDMLSKALNDAITEATSDYVYRYRDVFSQKK